MGEHSRAKTRFVPPLLAAVFVLAMAGNAIPGESSSKIPDTKADARAELIAEHFHRPTAEIEALHGKDLKYAEIVKLLVIARMSKKPIPDLLKKSREGRGWGTISRELGLETVEVKKNIEDALQSIKRRRRQASRANAVATYFHRPASDIQDLRNQGVGYGEIVKILVIAQMTRRPLPELLDKNRQGYGWGTISRQAGLDTAEVLKKVEKARQDLKIRTRTAAGPKNK